MNDLAAMQRAADALHARDPYVMPEAIAEARRTAARDAEMGLTPDRYIPPNPLAARQLAPAAMAIEAAPRPAADPRAIATVYDDFEEDADEPRLIAAAKATPEDQIVLRPGMSPGSPGVLAKLSQLLDRTWKRRAAEDRAALETERTAAATASKFDPLAVATAQVARAAAAERTWHALGADPAAVDRARTALSTATEQAAAVRTALDEVQSEHHAALERLQRARADLVGLVRAHETAIDAASDRVVDGDAADGREVTEVAAKRDATARAVMKLEAVEHEKRAPVAAAQRAAEQVHHAVALAEADLAFAEAELAADQHVGALADALAPLLAEAERAARALGRDAASSMMRVKKLKVQLLGELVRAGVIDDETVVAHRAPRR